MTIPLHSLCYAVCLADLTNRFSPRPDLGPERIPLVLIVKVRPFLDNLPATPTYVLAHSALQSLALASSRKPEER